MLTFSQMGHSRSDWLNQKNDKNTSALILQSSRPVENFSRNMKLATFESTGFKQVMSSDTPQKCEFQPKNNLLFSTYDKRSNYQKTELRPFGVSSNQYHNTSSSKKIMQVKRDSQDPVQNRRFNADMNNKVRNNSNVFTFDLPKERLFSP